MSEYALIEKLDEIKDIVKSKVSDKWLNISEVCDYSGLSNSTIRRAINKGVLKASHSTGKLLFKISDVDRWLNG